MGDPSAETAPSAKPPDDRLDSWKQIAAYLNRDLTTVQRWERREGMPVHRHLHDRMGSVYASRAELNAWVQGRSLRVSPESQDAAASADAQVSAAESTLLRKWRLPVFVAAAALGLAAVAAVWLVRADYFWRNPIANAQIVSINFDGAQHSAAVSRDAQFVAFLSDRDATTDVWVTQVGSGQFHNLTHGSAADLVNPSVRTLGFSPDGSFVTFWARKRNASGGEDINVWAVPTLGGQPRPYLEGVAEFNWSPDASRLVYHTPGPGDPTFVSDANRSDPRPLFTASAGLHCHFPTWAPDMKFVYFVQGSLPDRLDVWRIRPAGGTPERVTSHTARVTYPVLLDQRTLMYLATDPDGSGPWLYSADVEHRIPHKLNSIDRYTSLAASADGRRIVLTTATPKSTLWRLRLGDSTTPSEAARISLTTSTGFSPRLGPTYLLYVSGESIWKLANGVDTELWTARGAQVFGGPAISPDGRSIAFSVRQQGRSRLYTMQADGTNVRVVTDSLDLQGTPAWGPGDDSLTSAANNNGTPSLYRIPLNGRAPELFLQEYALDPAWVPGGGFVLFSGADIGTTFSVKAVTPQAAPHPLAALTLTRGARHLAFLRQPHTVVLLRGEIQHKNLWLIDLDTGAERQLTNLPSDFDIRDFDISPDGREVVLERIQERSDVVLLNRPEHNL